MPAQQPLPLVSSCLCMILVCVRVLRVLPAVHPRQKKKGVSTALHTHAYALHTMVPVLLSRVSSSVTTRVARLTIVAFSTTL